MSSIIYHELRRTCRPVADHGGSEAACTTDDRLASERRNREAFAASPEGIPSRASRRCRPARSAGRPSRWPLAIPHVDTGESTSGRRSGRALDSRSSVCNILRCGQGFHAAPSVLGRGSGVRSAPADLDGERPAPRSPRARPSATAHDRSGIMPPLWTWPSRPAPAVAHRLLARARSSRGHIEERGRRTAGPSRRAGAQSSAAGVRET